MDADTALPALVDELRRGIDVEQNFARLSRRFRPALLRFFARLGVAGDLGQDLTQETLLGIYTGIGAFRSEARFESWLFRIATNVFRKHLRRQAAGKRAAPEVALDEIEAPDKVAALAAGRHSAALGPEASALDRERRRLLLAAVDELPDRMRRCLILRAFQELTYEEIAMIMQLSTETVRSHLFQARRRLKERLRELDGDPLAAEGNGDE